MKLTETFCNLEKRVLIKKSTKYFNHNFNYYCQGEVRKCSYGIIVNQHPYCFYDLYKKKWIENK